MPSLPHVYEGVLLWSPLFFFYQLVLVALVWLCVMLHWDLREGTCDETSLGGSVGCPLYRP